MWCSAHRTEIKLKMAVLDSFLYRIQQEISVLLRSEMLNES